MVTLLWIVYFCWLLLSPPLFNLFLDVIQKADDSFMIFVLLIFSWIFPPISVLFITYWLFNKAGDKREQWVKTKTSSIDNELLRPSEEPDYKYRS